MAAHVGRPHPGYRAISRVFIYNQLVVHEDLKWYKTLLKRGDYAALEKAVAGADLQKIASLWSRLAPLQKLVVFKLLDAPRAMEFYGRLPFKEKYYLLCGFPLNAIAPVLEGLAPADRRRFVQLPRPFYDRMFRRLVASRPAGAGAGRY